MRASFSFRSRSSAAIACRRPKQRHLAVTALPTRNGGGGDRDMGAATTRRGVTRHEDARCVNGARRVEEMEESGAPRSQCAGPARARARVARSAASPSSTRRGWTRRRARFSTSPPHRRVRLRVRLRARRRRRSRPVDVGRRARRPPRPPSKNSRGGFGRRRPHPRPRPSDPRHRLRRHHRRRSVVAVPL
jgi:hypothetical protein